jgi:hypothetical protein
MRRIVGFVLLGLGAFLLTMSLLLKVYAYPSLAVAPLDQETTTTSIGVDMAYLSVAARAQLTDTLTSTIHVVGDVKAAEDKGDNIAIWNQATSTTTSDGTVISTETIRVPFDRTTGQAVDCCGAYTQENQDPPVPTKFDGLNFKFPFNTQKHSYDWWDGDLGRSVPIEYDGVEKLDGLLTYRFTQTIEPEQVGTTPIPSKLLGEPAGQMLTAQEWYSNQRTYNVEPETGAIVKAVENPNSVFMYNGEQRLIKTQGTTGFTDGQVKDNIKEYKDKGSQLHLVRVVLPLAGLILGLLFVLVGAAVIAVARRRDNDSLDEEVEDVELPHHPQTI